MSTQNRPFPWNMDDYRHRDRSGPIEILRGAPIDLEFCGWRSNTHILQQHGWQIAESRNFNNLRYEDEWHLAIRHPMLGASGMSNKPLKISRMHRTFHGPDIHLHIDIGLPYMVARMEQMNFLAVDTRPVWETIDRPSDLYHMPYFRPVGEDKDIYIERASVEEILQIALDKQMPNQAEIRARRLAEKRRDDYRNQDEIAARLVMVA